MQGFLPNQCNTHTNFRLYSSALPPVFFNVSRRQLGNHRHDTWSKQNTLAPVQQPPVFFYYQYISSPQAICLSLFEAWRCVGTHLDAYNFTAAGRDRE